MRTILPKALIALAITTIGALAADNTIGTWKLNIVKSRYDPARMPVKSLIVTRVPLDGGIKVTTSAERVDGTAINFSYSAKYDSKDVQVLGNAPYDTIAIKQWNANTLTDERKKVGGPYHVTSRTAISNGGNTMTTVTAGTNAVGRAFMETFVYEKQ